jgi:hypothetical protein
MSPQPREHLIALLGRQTELGRDLFFDFRHSRLALRGAFQNREHESLVIRNGHGFDP